jgi:hypothetical protein
MWLHTCPSAISPCRRIRLACGRYINVSQARSSGSCRNGLIVIEGFGTSLPGVFFRLCHLIHIYNAHSWLCLYSKGWKWRLCKHLHRTRIQSNSYSSSLDTDVPVHTISFPARIQCSTFAFRILDWGWGSQYHAALHECFSLHPQDDYRSLPAIGDPVS